MPVVYQFNYKIPLYQLSGNYYYITINYYINNVLHSLDNICNTLKFQSDKLFSRHFKVMIMFEIKRKINYIKIPFINNQLLNMECKYVKYQILAFHLKHNGELLIAYTEDGQKSTDNIMETPPRTKQTKNKLFYEIFVTLYLFIEHIYHY